MEITRIKSGIGGRLSKIWGIILCIVTFYVIVYYVANEPHIQRYEGIFVGFIETYLNNHISLDYFSLIPLFSPGVEIDPSLSNTVQHIMETESYIPNFVALFLILHYITGLSPQLLVVLPLGILFVPIAYLAIIKAYVPVKDSPDLIFQFSLAVYITVYLVATRWYGSFYVAPTAFLLLLALFLCIKRFYEEDGRRRSVYYLIICISMLSLAHYWHTILMMIVFFIISLWIVSGFFYLLTLILPKFANNREKKNTEVIFLRSTSLLVISIVISLTFTHLWQSQYIALFLTEVSLWDFLSNALVKLFGGNPFPVSYAFSYKDLFWGKIYFISLLLLYILATLTLIIPILLYILQFICKKATKVTLPLIFGLSILLAQIIHVIGYYKSNSLAFPLVPLFFPIFGVYIFINTIDNKEKVKKFIILSLSTMAIASLICIISLNHTSEGGTTSVTKYKDTKSSFEWLYHNMDRYKTITTDFNVLGKYLQREAKLSKPSIEYRYISPNSYGVLVGDNEVIPKYLTKNYVVVDHATMSEGLPIHSNTARALLKPEWARINNCQNQDKIYQDNYVSIFIFK